MAINELIIIADAAQGVQAQHLEPLLHHTAAHLTRIESLARRQLDLATRRSLGRVAISLQPHFRRTSQEVCDAIGLLRDARPDARLSLLDSTDPTAVRWPEAVARVDAYVKKQLFADLDAHAARSDTGYWFADYCAHTLGWDLQGWSYASTPVPADALHKLNLAWNLGVGTVHRRLAVRNRLYACLGRSGRWANRSIAVNCVVQTLGEQDPSYYSRHRRAAVAALMPLQRGRRTLIGLYGGGVPAPRSASRYRHALRRSKVCVSPFGWGEICHRDVEAMLCGCLLLKPDMRLVRTMPDLFRPFETYVPVRWDLADLAETCARWLDQPADAAAIAERGRLVAQHFLRRRAVAPQARQVHDRLLGIA